MARSSYALAVAAGLFVLPFCYGRGTNDQVNNPNIPYGSFNNPSAYVRPKWRYWIPDASVDPAGVANDVAEAAAQGAGGMELFGYYLYGGTNPAYPAYVPTDWAVYGWGTDAWKTNIQDTAVQAVNDNNMIIDFALGVGFGGAGVPSQYDDLNLERDIQPFYVNVSVGGSFNGTLPGWGTGPLISASTGLVISGDVGNAASVLSTSSLTEVTHQVNAQGQISLSFPNATGTHYILSAFYLIFTHQREQVGPLDINSNTFPAKAGVPQSQPASFRNNGSNVWDHFTVGGAQVAINYWNKYLFTGTTGKLLKKVGNYVWEDSIEFFPRYAWWTTDLPKVFQQEHGYSINKYLPIIVRGQVGFVNSVTVPLYNTDQVDTGLSYLEDYRQTLTNMYSTYLQTMDDWANSLGLQYSAQPSYNAPFDMLANIPSVNAPETETLGFSHNIDGFRQFSGPANLAGKRVISSETGANMGIAYAETIPNLLWDVKRAFAGGVNTHVFHGYPYSGYYPNTTWPGFAGFDFEYCEMHGPRQPAWDFYGEFLNYTARIQWVLQTGIPKVDVAFYLKAVSYYLGTSYSPTDLQAAGYTYEYLSPDNFALPAAHVANNVLAPERQAFKALIVRANDTMTVDGVTCIAMYAHQGLPVVFAGGVPTLFWGNNATGAAYVNTTLQSIMSLKNVHTVPYAGLAAFLASIGVLPRAQVSANGTWYAQWREDTANAMTYVMLYNDATGIAFPGGSTTGHITIATTGAPMLYDAWTGEITPVTVFTETSTSITIPLTIAGNQTVVIGIKHGKTVGASTAAAPLNAVAVSAVSASTYSVKSTVGLAPITLGPWNLTIEAWSPPADLYAFNGSTVKTNTSYTLDTLVSWRHIPNTNLTNVSGRGYYTTTLLWPPAGKSKVAGAIIDLGSIVHFARVYVNGALVPPLDPVLARADIGAYLKKGTNNVEVVVATTLINVISPFWSQQRTSGGAPTFFGTGFLGPAPIQDYGLIYPVVVEPYKTVVYSK